MKINGMTPEKRSAICATCGAKLKRADGKFTCPNHARADHNGRAYAGGARLPKDEPNNG